MELNIYCKYSYVDKYDRSVFVLLDAAGREKLARFGHNKREIALKTPDIGEYLGRDCILRVRPSRYNFTTADGRQMQGYSLKFVDINYAEDKKIKSSPVRN